MALRAAGQESGASVLGLAAQLWLGTQMTPQIAIKAQKRPCQLTPRHRHA